ncbi:MAG: RNA methyltransferase [Chromatiales bacterium]|nr:RNA methyltransferase [Chromatiales bacterium]
MTLVSSPDNPRFRWLLGLADSPRCRRSEQLALLDGLHLVSTACERLGTPELLVISARARENPELAAWLERQRVEPLVLAPGLFRRISPLTTPTGLLAVVRIPSPGALPSIDEPAVLLDAIQDPGNLGSILRSAAAAGLRSLLLSTDCADPWSPRVLRAGMGAHFSLSIHERVDLPAWARARQTQVLGCEARGETTLWESRLTGPVALAFGNEGRGISGSLRAELDAVVSIPMSADSESLNVAAAAAICLFERARQSAASAGPRRAEGARYGS